MHSLCIRANMRINIFAEPEDVDAFAYAHDCAPDGVDVGIAKGRSRQDLVNLYEFYAHVYAEHKTTMRRLAPKKLYKRIRRELSCESPPLSKVLSFAKTDLFDHPDADDSVPDANYVLAVVGTCLKELRILLDAGSIEDAVLLTMDPNAYFEYADAEAGVEGRYVPLI